MKTTKQIAAIASIVLLAGIMPVPAHAESLRELRKDVKSEIRDIRKNAVEERKELKSDLREKVASKVSEIKAFFQARISLVAGKITAINGTTITVEKDGKIYTVLTGSFEKCDTKFRRRFWGQSRISEYVVGHQINVLGRWQDESKTTIEACVIRDLSIQKRFGVFVGNVLSLSGSGWTMSTVSTKRADQTVTVTASTKFVNRKEEAIVRTDIKTGDRVRVKGMWDSLNNTVTEVTHVKDYSLPTKTETKTEATVTATVKPTATVSLTPTVTSTVTLTPTP